MTNVAPPGQAGQKRGKQLSHNAQIDAVVMLAWMTNGMELPNGAIAKAANDSIVLELAVQKIWLHM